MFRNHHHRHPPPLDSRAEAWRPITGDLLAAASGQPLELATLCVAGWFRCAYIAGLTGIVLVFDDFVIRRWVA